MKQAGRDAGRGVRKPLTRRAYSVAEVASMFGTSEMTVRRAIKSGELPAIRLRGRLVVPAKALDALTDEVVARQNRVGTELTPGGAA